MPIVSRLTLKADQWGRIVFVALAAIVYFISTLLSIKPGSPSNSYNIPLVALYILSLTIIGLLLLGWFFGLYAWLQLDRYTRELPPGAPKKSYGQIARGIEYLTLALILPTLISASRPLYANDVNMTAVVTQINYYAIIVLPFLGFLYLRQGTKHLAVSAQAAMTLVTKLVTVGPPVLLLACFYIFLALTNSTPQAGSLSGSAGTIALWVSILLIVSSWVLGLLAALNIERWTHRGDGADRARPLVKLYNGILLTTCGFIILDALLSLDATRLRNLPIEVVLGLVYLFIGVVALGFMTVGVGARRLRAINALKAGR